MTDPQAIAELIARAEAATTVTDEHALIGDALRLARDRDWIDQDAFNNGMRLRGTGAFLEAALTLVPEKHHWGLSHCEDWHNKGYHATVGPEWLGQMTAWATTPALALCIVALKAIAAGGGG